MNLKSLFLASLLSLILFSTSLFAQTQNITYQGTAISSSGQVLISQLITVRLSVFNDIASGIAAYVETQNVTTSANGAFSVQVGSGAVVIGTYSSLNLMSSTHYLQVEIKPGSGAYNTISKGPIAQSTVACPPNPPSTPTAASHVPSTTQIVWNWTSTADATAYKWNIVNDYATATEMGAALTKTETGLTCNTAYTRYVWAYTACGHSVALTLNQNTSSCPFTCGNSITVNHVIGAVAPVNKTVTYGTVTNVPAGSGLCWITSNLGADHQADNLQDASEASAGWYWQYNHLQGFKHDGTNLTPNIGWISSMSGPTNWLLTNDPCNSELGSGWRVPTDTELHNLSNGWIWGYSYITGLKIHCAGYLDYNAAALEGRGTWGMYGSSVAANSGANYCLFFESAYTGISPYNMADGFSLRCTR